VSLALLADTGLLGGPDLLIYLLLAFGGAMLVGNLLALLRPPNPTAKKRKPSDRSRVSAPNAKPRDNVKPTPAAETRQKPPKGRTIAMAAIGGLVTLWAVATLLTK
jgi:hypothetical protein